MLQEFPLVGIALWAKSFAFGKFQIFLSQMLMRPAVSNKGYEGALYSWATTPISSGLKVPSILFLYAPRFLLPL